jgi:hypothetical protein
MMKSRRMKWTGEVTCITWKGNISGIFVGKPEGKRLLGRPRRRWDDNVKIDLRETEFVECICLAQDRNKWRALVNTKLNLRLQ